MKVTGHVDTATTGHARQDPAPAFGVVNQMIGFAKQVDCRFYAESDYGVNGVDSLSVLILMIGLG